MYSKEELQKRKDELAPWHAPIYLGHDVWTNPQPKAGRKPSWYFDNLEWAMGGIEGKRIMDIGSNTGYMAVECALRGASVVSIEAHPKNVERCKFVYEARGVSDRVELLADDMEKISLETHGKFDAILFCGTVYHCTYPWEVMNNFGKMAEHILVESVIVPSARVNDRVHTPNRKIYEFEKTLEIGGHELGRPWTAEIRRSTRRTLMMMIQDAGFTNVSQLMPVAGVTPKYHSEEDVVFLANNRKFRKIEIYHQFDK